MNFFGFKKKRFGEGQRSRFQQNRFQARIREARAYHRVPKILPQAKTNITLRGYALRWKLALAGAGLALLSLGYFIIFTDYFLVRQAQVSGNQQIAAENINQWLKEAGQEKYWGLLPKNNWLTLSAPNLESILTSRTTRILKISSKRAWPNQIKLELEERLPVAIWHAAGDYFYLSQDSVLTEQLPVGYATSTKTFIHIVDLSNQPAVLGDKLPSHKLLEFINSLNSIWTKETHTTMGEIRIPGRGSSDVFIVSSAGWVVYLDLNSEALPQARALGLILSREITAERVQGLAYIDLRLATTAYYCFLSEPCAALTLPDQAAN